MSSKHVSCAIPERFLRRIWIQQSFPASELKTTDGRPLKIILPGRLNRNSGPDFIGARIRIGEILFTGDVELHRYSENWREHRHHKDPRYNSVILHVVYGGKQSHAPPLTKSGRPVPVFILGNYLTASSRRDQNTSDTSGTCEGPAPIRCRDLNRSVSSRALRLWLEKLAAERIDMKIRRFEERLKELNDEQNLVLFEPPPCYGDLPFGLNPDELPPPAHGNAVRHFNKLADWEQLMYEGFMEALGYENNQDPFLRLSRNLNLRTIARHFTAPSSCDPAPRLEAAFFRVSGLLDTAWEPAGKGVRSHMKMLRNLWKLSGHCYTGGYIASTDWQFFRLRPENFPTLRIAGAARLLPRLIRKNFFKRIIQIVRGDLLTVKQRYSILEGLFIVPADGFWAAHYLWGERAHKPVKTLIGRGRAGEIIVNVIVPICLLYARIFRDEMLRDGTLMLLRDCPPSIENNVTSAIADQLIKGRFALDTAFLQQGALQLHKMYCTEERCPECAVGTIVFKG